MSHDRTEPGPRAPLIDRGAVPDAATARFDTGSGLRWLAAVGAGGLALSLLYATTGRGLPCPFHRLTGWWCPLCGGTRMGAALLNGDPAAAFWFNPLAFIALPIAVVLGTVWLLEALGAPAIRPPARLTAALTVPARHRAALVIVLLLGFTVLRNLGRPFGG